MDFPNKLPSICPACNTKFNIVYYQRRAADEPPDKVVYCSNCPLDTTKLSLDNSIQKHESYSYSTLFSKKNNIKDNTIALPSKLTKVDTRISIVVKGNAALRCYKNIIAKGTKYKLITAVPVTINTENKSIKSYYYLSSSTKYETHINKDSNTIAPFVVYKNTDIYKYTNPLTNTNDPSKCIVGYEYMLPTIQYSLCTVLRTLHDGEKPYILILLSENNKNSIINVLESILVNYGTELSIKSIITSTILNTLYIQSGRAYDWPSAPNNGYTYAWKPDGERFWYVKYGSIWLFSRRLLSGKIAGWNICPSLQVFTNIGPILDVEVMIGFDPILIDILISDNTGLMPVSRTLDFVLDEYNSIKDNNIIDVPIHVREYYRSEKELLNTKDKLQYPVDGVVGIQDGSMTIIKLKDEKSIELQLAENGNLITSDNHIVASSNLQNNEEIGSIVEIRFTKQSKSDTPIINEVFVRTDKVKANDMQACINIINTISDTPDMLARRNVVQWCNSIRLKLNQVAAKTSGKGRVILDIGAGDGQAVSDYSTDSEVTYLLIEPNQRKCNSMFRRLQDAHKNNVRLLNQPSDILNALRLLITKKVKYVVLCASLKQILEQKDCIRTLKTCVRCCIASLSISYIVSELQELTLEGLNVIGFGYMYDSVNNRGELINEGGVTMKYTSYQSNIHSNDAIVQWGTDTAYIEPAITLKDFQEVFYCKLAKNIMPIIADSKVSLLNTVSSNVYIITNSKYII